MTLPNSLIPCTINCLAIRGSQLITLYHKGRFTPVPHVRQMLSTFVSALKLSPMPLLAYNR